MSTPPLYLCGTVDSVLDLAHTFTAEFCLPIWGSILAGSQRFGRGQLRRGWISPPGNIYGALRLPLVAPFTASAASLVVGTLLVEAFMWQGIRLSLKWPNDLLLVSSFGSGTFRGFSAGKVGGILLEERAGALIAGIGINVASTPSCEHLREGSLPAACLNDLPHIAIQDMDVLPYIWSCLVDAFIFCYRHLEKFDNEAWLRSAEQHLVWKGEQVLLDDGECHQGVLLGLAASGGVRLLCDGIEKEFLSGNLSSIHRSIFSKGCLFS